MKTQIFTKINYRAKTCLRLTVLITALTAANFSSAADEKSDGKFYGDFRLRYESASQDNALRDADALTLRARIGYVTDTVKGFSAVIEGEANVEIIDDFSVPPAGVRPGQFSVIADPETEEIDQAYVKYSADSFTAKVGRQVFTLDGHRFVGHVGWRQDRQTFDGVVVNYKPNDKLNLTASYINKRNRIFADEADLDSNDTLLHSSYETAFGKVTGYAYLLEVDNGLPNSLDTYGINFSGSTKAGDTKLLYTAEIATQEANDLFDTEYLFVEGGAVVNGITVKIGYELLGSDNGQKGFATPLATLHKFNGFSDQFLVTPAAGLEDIYLRFAGKLAGGKWLATAHTFSSNESVNGADDLGNEINLQYTRKFSDRIGGGLKLANYSAGDTVFKKLDTDKFWLWLSVKL
jgi:hypothetical protein